MWCWQCVKHSFLGVNTVLTTEDTKRCCLNPRWSATYTTLLGKTTGTNGCPTDDIVRN